MGIITKTGDDGSTGLASGKRVAKNSPQICFLGSLDELCAFTGDAKFSAGNTPLRLLLEEIQKDLFGIMGNVAAEQLEADGILPALKDLENKAAEHGQNTVARGFVVPGASSLSAKLAICRAVCRRAERDAVSLDQAGAIPREIVMYLNRLSDFLFILARENDGQPG